MTSTDLFTALNNIDEKFIEEAAPGKTQKVKRVHIKKALPVAACLCLIIATAFHMKLSNNRISPYYNFTEIQFDSMGYEGADSLSLWNSTDINPYSADTLPEMLPVFQNLCYSGGLYQNYFSENKLQQKVLHIAESLGENEFEFSTVKAEIDTDDPNYEENLIYNVIGESEQFLISVNGGRYSISPKTAEASDILKGYLEANFDTENMGEYETYSVDGELVSTKYIAYKRASTTEENIVSFSLSSAEIHFKNDASIDFVILNDYLNCSEKVMSYNTIPLEKATNKLLLGADVSTSTPEELIIGGRVQKEHIVKTDIIYYTGNLQQAFVPYYRFYVKLINPDESTDIENYGLFYVPAVEIQ